MKKVISGSIEGVEVSIFEMEKHHLLQWHGEGYEEWQEFYPSLSFALLRFGALVACAESDWSKGFENDSADFVANAKKFLEVEVSSGYDI
jgi:hypothetical protein